MRKNTGSVKNEQKYQKRGAGTEFELFGGRFIENQ